MQQNIIESFVEEVALIKAIVKAGKKLASKAKNKAVVMVDKSIKPLQAEATRKKVIVDYLTKTKGAGVDYPVTGAAARAKEMAQKLDIDKVILDRKTKVAVDKIKNLSKIGATTAGLTGLAALDSKMIVDKYKKPSFSEKLVKDYIKSGGKTPLNATTVLAKKD